MKKGKGEKMPRLEWEVWSTDEDGNDFLVALCDSLQEARAGCPWPRDFVVKVTRVRAPKGKKRPA